MKLAERLKRLANRTLVATENNADYLVSLNFKALQKRQKRAPDQDARVFYEQLQKAAKQGPLFSEKVIEAIRHIQLPMEKPVAAWLGRVFQQDWVKAKGNSDMMLWTHRTPGFRMPQELRNILDFVKATHTDLGEMTWEQALAASEEWHEQYADQEAGEYESRNVVQEWPDGYTMVELGPADCATEGAIMQHCVGDPKQGYAERLRDGEIAIYSLRDPNNRPHATIEVYHPGIRDEVEQIQGKQNKPPIDKYRPYIEDFILSKDMRGQAIIPFLSTAALRKKIEKMLPLMHKDESVSTWVNHVIDSPQVDAKTLASIVRVAVENDEYYMVENALEHKNSDETVADAAVDAIPVYDMSVGMTRTLAKNLQYMKAIQTFVDRIEASYKRKGLELEEQTLRAIVRNPYASHGSVYDAKRLLSSPPLYDEISEEEEPYGSVDKDPE
jgi:hypothetical protein